MPKQTKVYLKSPVGQGDFVVAQEGRVSAREKAEIERTRKRLDMDARINVNASKWRYVCPGSR
jgi:hypothetical protein